MNFATLFGSLVDVTLVGILLGAGLPALFALGIRFAHSPSAEGANTVGKIAATICFGIIIVAVFVGILWVTKSTIYQYAGLDIFSTEG
ncbi:hypothetical protein [Corynebacterium crudilactis]|uniref:Uncharacterized protein n=1 Tax=Corynebacterium crudilactis TaxID=1652495 RepID=A0A172QR68_9CORY|nr:hypothetical protein [Corynebacterium crudilactis]ANE03174.1 hypothetical protein ccrud_02400 [Corynebacterium crudilactis]